MYRKFSTIVSEIFENFFESFRFWRRQNYPLLTSEKRKLSSWTKAETAIAFIDVQSGNFCRRQKRKLTSRSKAETFIDIKIGKCFKNSSYRRFGARQTPHIHPKIKPDCHIDCKTMILIIISIFQSLSRCGSYYARFLAFSGASLVKLWQPSGPGLNSRWHGGQPS